MIKFKAVVALLALAGLGGCAGLRDVSPDCPSTAPDALRKIDLLEVADRLVGEMCIAPAAEGGPEDVVIVSDPIDLKSYQPGQTGVLLGEVVRARLSARCKLKIRQVDLSRSLRLNEGGLSLLTREVKELQASEVAAKRAFVGTYSAMPGKLVLTLRDLDLMSGTIERISSKEVSFGCRSGLLDQGEFFVNIR